MLPSFLITFREVIEAALIVATILGVLARLGHTKSVRTVWLGVAAASGLSVALLGICSLFGVKAQEIYTGRVEEIIEGILMMTSAIFITWAVFFLHNFFTTYKVRLLQKVKDTIDTQEQKGIFLLVFTAVFREGFEIVLFLSTIYFSSNPTQIFTGFAGGIVAGLAVSAAFFTATLKMPVYYAFRTTSFLLILFAGGLLARGIHEFAEAGFLPELTAITFGFIPAKGHIVADLIKATFGITRHMDIAQLAIYSIYVFSMLWYVFLRKSPPVQEVA